MEEGREGWRGERERERGGERREEGREREEGSLLMLSVSREPLLFIILKDWSANRSITLSRVLPAMAIVLDCVCVCVCVCVGGGGGGGGGVQVSYSKLHRSCNWMFTYLRVATNTAN